MEFSYDKFLRIAESIAGEFGDAFLTRLVEVLKDHMSASFVAVTVAEGTPPTHARALYAQEDGQNENGYRYALEGSPCKRVYQGEDVLIPCDLASEFPEEAEYEGYLGVPLRATEGDQVVGHLAVFSDSAVLAPEIAMATLRIFAQRAQAELQRLAHEAEREELLAELTDLNDRMRHNYSKLHDENAQKSRLMGLIAHDLRSPLSVVVSQAELGIARSEEGTKIHSGFEKVLSNAERMSGMIQSTLDQARGEGALTLNLRASLLETVLRTAVDSNLAEAERKNIAVRLSEAGTDIVLVIDDVLVTSAVDNLVSNAIKYTGEGGDVSVSAEVEPDRVSIVVSDTGQGLTDEDLQRVFGRFQQLSARPTAGESSTGLGLANVREIAEAHGGKAEATSDGKGLGATFRICLPRERNG